MTFDDPPFWSGMPGCYRPNKTALPADSPELPQRRTLGTEIPGPASRALMERRSDHPFGKVALKTSSRTGGG
jgi:hypothetical protein